jgi:hypothetical protein
LDNKECIVDGQPQHFELLYYNPEIQTVYSVSYKDTLFSAKIIDNKIASYDAKVVEPGLRFHGVARSTDSTLYVTNMVQNTILEYNPSTGENRGFVCEGGVRMKDAAIINDDVMLAISSDNGPAVGREYPNVKLLGFYPPYDSHVFVYRRDTGKLVSKHIFPKTQIDAVVYYAPFCFVTCTDGFNGKGYLMRFTLDDTYKFTNPTKLPCAGFPHGIAIRNNILAYTSYTDSALYVHRLTEDGAIV